jgi:hypothetical protein
MLVVSSYFWNGEGGSERNRKLAHDTAGWIAQQGTPFVWGGDFQNSPEEVESWGFINLIGGMIACAGVSTNRHADSEIDFFIIDARLGAYKEGASKTVDSVLTPHKAVELRMQGKLQKGHWRQRRAPAPPKNKPIGCVPPAQAEWGAVSGQAEAWGKIMCATEADKRNLDALREIWYKEAAAEIGRAYQVHDKKYYQWKWGGKPKIVKATQAWTKVREGPRIQAQGIKCMHFGADLKEARSMFKNIEDIGNKINNKS